MQKIPEFSSFLGAEVQKAKREIGETAFIKLLQRCKDTYGEAVISKYPDEIFKLWNTYPKFLDFAQKERLQTESGLVIANHPGIFDIPIVLEALKVVDGKVRRDMKILVHSSHFDNFADNLGKEYFEKLVTGEYQPAKDSLDRGLKHIQSGGVFVIFPSGGFEQTPGQQFKVSSGLVYLLESLDPEKMVYSMSINTHDFVLATQGKRRFLPSRADVAGMSEYLGVPNPNILRSKRSIQVKGRYGLASEWRKSMEGEKYYSGKSDRLTKRFLEIHGDNL